MGRLNLVNNEYGKADVAAVIHKLFAQQVRTGAANLNPAELASRLVNLVWAERANLVNGIPGQKPHKVTIAAFALAHGFQSLPASDLNRQALTLALSNILAEIEVNGNYPLNNLDDQLVATATGIFAEMLEAFNGTAAAN